jgi:hypothetical protein
MERMALRRFRWRMRGAWLWPSFAAASIAGGVLLDRLPLAGAGTGLVAGIILAGFLNLAAVVVVGGVGGMLLRRRRPDLPREIARDYAATVGVGLVCTVLLTGGLIHRPALAAQDREFAAQSAAARRFLAHRAPPDVRPNVALADSVQLGDGLYRTCAPGRRPDRAFCIYVSTDQSPPGIRVDTNRAPNATFVGRRSGPGG